MTQHPSATTKPPADPPFWRRPLSDLTAAEWESLCDGCGRCCLVKLEDEDTGAIHFTDISCKLLDPATCRCSDYAHRQTQVPDCVKLTPAMVGSLNWLPPTCAYRLVDEGRDLMWWHPLVSGRPETVREAGISISGRPTISEDQVPFDALQGHIVSWPTRWPKKSRRPNGIDASVPSPRPASRTETPSADHLPDPGAVRRQP